MDGEKRPWTNEVTGGRKAERGNELVLGWTILDDRGTLRTLVTVFGKECVWWTHREALKHWASTFRHTWRMVWNKCYSCLVQFFWLLIYQIKYFGFMIKYLWHLKEPLAWLWAPGKHRMITQLIRKVKTVRILSWFPDFYHLGYRNIGRLRFHFIDHLHLFIFLGCPPQGKWMTSSIYKIQYKIKNQNI